MKIDKLVIHKGQLITIEIFNQYFCDQSMKRFSIKEYKSIGYWIELPNGVTRYYPNLFEHIILWWRAK